MGLALIGVGVLLVILAYVVALPGGNLNLFLGFGLMAGGLILLSRWR